MYDLHLRIESHLSGHAAKYQADVTAVAADGSHIYGGWFSEIFVSMCYADFGGLVTFWKKRIAFGVRNVLT
jgi:hypothetical protein